MAYCEFERVNESIWRVTHAQGTTQAIFECGSCGRQSTADARMAASILPFKRKLPIEANGQCRHCGGESCTISAIYAETGTDIQESALGLGMMAVSGYGFTQESTHANQLIYPDVPAAVVARLNEHPAERMARVGGFVQVMEREKLKKLGGQECTTCGALFVPAAGRVWDEAGYCSKMCLVKDKGPNAIPQSSTADEEAKPTRVNSIQAQCPSGHSFEVAASFSGMLRPCPQCGSKTLVGDTTPG